MGNLNTQLRSKIYAQLLTNFNPARRGIAGDNIMKGNLLLSGFTVIVLVMVLLMNECVNKIDPPHKYQKQINAYEDSVRKYVEICQASTDTNETNRYYKLRQIYGYKIDSLQLLPEKEEISRKYNIKLKNEMDKKYTNRIY
jgi:hypothetical protein